LLKLVRSLMDGYPHCVLLTRVGDFYESYYEHADDVGAMLDIQVVTRKIRSHHFRFTGFPARSIDRHLESLVMGHRRHVAICEQFQDPITRIFSRRLVRIVTPGTLIDEQFLNADQNNYLLAIYPMEPAAPSSDITTPGHGSPQGGEVPSDPPSLGLAWLDLATGDFLSSTTTISDLESDLTRIKPREIVIPEPFQAILAKCLENMGRSLDAFVVSTRPLARFQVPLSEEDSDPFFTDPLGRPPGQFLDFIRAQNLSDTELRASRGLMRYVIETQAGKVPHLQTATHLNAAQTMKIDSFTFRSLEILESMTASSTTSRATGGSLIHIIDHTQTKAGSRMLSEYLRAPLTSIPELNERLDLVQLFFDSPDLLHRTRTILRDARDAQRAVQKLSLGYGGPADLLDIASALEAVTQIREPSTEAPHRLFKGIVSLDGLVQVIRNHIHPDAPRRVNGRGFIQGSSSSALNRLHNDLAKLESDLGKLELLLRTRFSSNSLKLIMQTGSRSYIEVSPRDAKSIVTDPEFEVFQTLRGKHRFLYKPWMLLAEYIQATNEAIFQEEMALYQSVLGQVLHQSQRIVGNCRSLAQIDVAASCAHLARDFGYTRPVFRTDQPGLFRIQDGRHPVVENNLRRKSRHFISNDCHLDSERPTALLTGPNMGGKSTFLRQNAIIAILAQIGSFVPARLAELSIIDRVFSRVGASDNLAENQSTFMVEMAETAHILTHATSQSLVIVDEVGRGTSTVDGLAIAYATLVRLARDIGCRSLVATHYHELTDLAGISPMLATAEPLLPPPSGHFSFVHKVLPGVSRESHGIQVAQLAGFPEEALQIARAL
ncbi:muts domain V-domain-containing protein, partial [Dimargaris cristalligena]